MKQPIFVRPLTSGESQQLEAGLRSPDSFVMRRCQIVLASCRGERAPRIATSLGCNVQTVRNVIHAFNNSGLQCLIERSRRAHTIHAAFDAFGVNKLRALVHQSPRSFGKATSLWTLELAAQVSFEQGLTPRRVSGETVRAALARLGIRWLRAKQWITSPDPEYARKKGTGTD